MPLKDKEESLIIEFSLIHAQSIDELTIVNETTNAMILMEDWSNGGI